MQRVGASYVGKKVYDYLMTPSEQAGEPEPEAGPVQPVAADAPIEDGIDGQVIHDDEGQPLGAARRVAGVGVYLVFDGYINAGREFAEILSDPETRLLWREDEGRITALFYVPDPSRDARRPRAMRADDV